MGRRERQVDLGVVGLDRPEMVTGREVWRFTSAMRTPATTAVAGARRCEHLEPLGAGLERAHDRWRDADRVESAKRWWVTPVRSASSAPAAKRVCWPSSLGSSRQAILVGTPGFLGYP
jgi:hypothetical protein